MVKKVLGISIILYAMLFCLTGCYITLGPPNTNEKSLQRAQDDMLNVQQYLLEPGGVFECGSYIEIESVQFLYDGASFIVQNNRDDIVRVSCCVVGVKKDGTYEDLQWPAFGGVDETLYEKDLAENGWAIKHVTNMVRPGETLIATMTIFNFGNDFPDPDIDGDGYYDVVFTISPQTSEDSIMVSTSDPESEVYRLKVK